MPVLAVVGFVVLRECRLVAVLQKSCCLEPRACVITAITVIVFTHDDGYLHEDVAGGPTLGGGPSVQDIIQTSGSRALATRCFPISLWVGGFLPCFASLRDQMLVWDT